MKKHLLLFFTVFIALLTVNVTAFAENTYISVTVDGEMIEFDQPPILANKRTLVPIRAVCEKIGADVKWEESTQSIRITKGDISILMQIDSYEMLVNDTRVYLDVTPQVYNGRTLLPIRSVVEKFGYDVKWDSKSSTVVIENINSMFLPKLRDTTVNYLSNWADVSSVQQFPYKNEGIAYAYVAGNNLNITIPSGQLKIDVKYPLLGDVISDDDGNFYVVWGLEGEVYTDETVFISKYSPEGVHIKTAGFKGDSAMGSDGNTKEPFSGGNCVSAIENGYLMVNYAREMYNGHQSNNVIGVTLSDMSPVVVENIWELPYVSHSFNQSVIWSDKANGFVYADHGDAYDRGFVINTDKGAKLVFNFYLEANANYNMYIVNRTFAQLGGLAETSKGVVLVGASAKSIGEAAKIEKQNLFVQIFNPLADEVSASMFVGGIKRIGATAYSIYDNQNSPLTQVADYGVHWLTDYTGTDAIAPQVVVADDNIVILWSTANNSYYMVLDAGGEVITPATSLEGLPLNSYEQPIYHNGEIYWAACINSILRVINIKL